MLKEINECDISTIITGYNLNLQIPDYTSTDLSDGKQGYGLAFKCDIDVILGLLMACDCKNIFEFGK